MTLPRSIAPFEVVIVTVNYQNNDQVRELADSLYSQLNDAGIDTLLDDRDEGPGAKFADADLIGMPVRVVVSPRSIKNGGVEIKDRLADQSDTAIHSVDEALNAIRSALRR